MAVTARSIFLHDQAARLGVARREGIKEKDQETAVFFHFFLKFAPIVKSAM